MVTALVATAVFVLYIYWLYHKSQNSVGFDYVCPDVVPLELNLNSGNFVIFPNSSESFGNAEPQTVPLSHFLNRLFAEDRDQLLERLTQTFKNEEMVNLKLRFVSQTHEHQSCYFQGSVSQWHRGTPRKIQGYLLGFRWEEDEMTDQERFQNELPTWNLQADLRGNVTYVNKKWLSTLGTLKDNLLGRQWVQFVHPADKAEVVSLWNELIPQEGNFDLCFRVVAPDKTEPIWLYGVMKPLKNRLGQVKEYLGSFHDVTAFKNAEQNLSILREKAMQFSKEKAEFLALISHEIRTSLNSILGLTELLQKTGLSPAQSDYVDALGKSEESLLKLVSEVQDVSEIEVGKLRLQNKSFNMSQLLTEIGEGFRPMIEKKGLRLLMKLEIPLSLQVNGDAKRLKQVLSNLLMNAVKFTQEGFIELRVKSIMSTENASLLVEVIDSGTGIAAENATKIFESYTGEHKGNNGTGLGLFICKGIVELMKGKIGVRSTLGKGSTFWFYVTLNLAAQAQLSPTAQQEEDRAKPVVVGPVRQGTRILVVDDNAINLKVALKMLEYLGHTAEPASNGVQAVASIEKNDYDLVLMDCQMPEMDGYEATRLIRERRQVPIVAMTANAIAGDREKCLESGMNDYISKPISMEKLNAIIERWSV